MRTCIYCGRNKNEDEFSEEHILPKVLVGTFEAQHQPFITNNVCRYCNNVSGMFIDAPAAKSWFIHTEIANGSARYAIIEENPILPLRYMGILASVTWEAKICEMYIGPAGATIYHFHEEYLGLDDLPPMIGVPPSIRKSSYDTGFVFLFFTTNNPVWFPTIVLSLIDAFPNSTLYCGNCKNLPTERFSDIPEELKPLIEMLHAMSGKNHSCKLKISPYSDTRFLAKLALGFGSKLLGDQFIESVDADALRNCMWGKTPETRNKIPIQGTGFMSDFEERKEMVEMYGLDGCHVISIINLPEAIVLNITLYCTMSATISICASSPKSKEVIGSGICYVIVPSLRKVIGPLRQAEFLSHKFDIHKIIPELSLVEEELRKRVAKPSRMI